MAETSVIIIEDCPETQAKLVQLINTANNFRLLGYGDSVSQGRTLLTRQTPDVALIDLGLPDGSGIDLIRFISKKNPATQVLVISAFAGEKDVITAIEAGACGYLLKGEDSLSILGSIEHMLAGGAPITPVIAKHLLKRFHRPAAVSEADTTTFSEETLTKREQDILQQVSRGFTSHEIAAASHISYHTVTTHVKNIYRKLAVSSRAAAVEAGHNRGLL